MSLFGLHFGNPLTGWANLLGIRSQDNTQRLLQGTRTERVLNQQGIKINAPQAQRLSTIARANPHQFWAYSPGSLPQRTLPPTTRTNIKPISIAKFHNWFTQSEDAAQNPQMAQRGIALQPAPVRLPIPITPQVTFRPSAGVGLNIANPLAGVDAPHNTLSPYWFGNGLQYIPTTRPINPVQSIPYISKPRLLDPTLTMLIRRLNGLV